MKHEVDTIPLKMISPLLRLKTQPGLENRLEGAAETAVRPSTIWSRRGQYLPVTRAPLPQWVQNGKVVDGAFPALYRFGCVGMN
jgi:hypothetical protein